MEHNFRTGPIGALLDEYEKAAGELKALLMRLSQPFYVQVIDQTTNDEDCRSVQTIMRHVVRAGYGYANYIGKRYGDPISEMPETEVSTPQLACTALDKMLLYTAQVLANKSNVTDKEMMEKIIDVRWGQRYDMEQLLEHAIVHILRHRRQIERFALMEKRWEIIR